MTDPMLSPDGRFAVYFKDAARMDEVPDASVPLACFSPPYAIGLRYYDEKLGPAPGQVERPVLSWGDYEQFLAGLFPVLRETYRKVAPSGYVVVNVAAIHAKSEHFGESFMLPIPDDIARYFRSELGAQLRWKNIWIAPRTNTNSNGETGAPHGSYPLPLEGQVRREIEEILVFRKPGRRGFDGMDYERAQRRRQSRMTVEEWYATFNQVWTFPGAAAEEVSEGFDHPAPFPVELPKRVIRGYSCIGDVVLDPFLGTGTTMLAARLLGRRCIGYEVQPELRDLIASKTGILGPPIGCESKLTAWEEPAPNGART